jgi:PleD family two-component response regulator
MIDVDHFKRFNHTYGHEVGDQVFRYGGEEFAVVFPGKELAATAPHLDALRVTIEGARFALRGRWRPRKNRRPIKLYDFHEKKSP